MRKEMLHALRGGNHPGQRTGIYGQRITKSLLLPGRPAKVPDVPREIEVSGERAQWWAEAPRPHSHWYLTESRRFVAVRFATVTGEPYRIGV